MKLGKVTVGIFHWSDTLAAGQTALGSKDEGFPFLSLWNRERVGRANALNRFTECHCLPEDPAVTELSPQLLWTLKTVP